MKHSVNHLDRKLNRIMKLMWVYLTFAAFCVLCTVCTMYADPQLALGTYHTVPQMIECLLAGCVVTVGLGTAFQYLGGR